MSFPLSIINFTDVYREESFYLHERFQWIDCTDVRGADCFCDNEASAEIQRRLSSVSPFGLHFIDSGNYHYLSKFFTDRLTEDFVLVVFDHHPDMQPSLFDGLLSCGDWVKAALDTNPHLRKVILVGTSDALLARIPDSYRSRLILYPESQLLPDNSVSSVSAAWQRFSDMHLTLPIYISIDKDVLAESVEDTNWDQGYATLPELKRLCSILLQHDRLLGVDICGECAPSIRGLLDPNLRSDNAVNLQLTRLFESGQ